MKAIFFNLPAHGHINPTLPVVRELIRRGDHILYYDGEEFRAKIEASGAEFRPYPAWMNQHGAVDAMNSDKVFAVAGVLNRAAEQIVPFALAELEREQPDYVIHDSLCVWGRIAAAVLHLPTVVTIGTFAFGSHVHDVRTAAREVVRSFPELIDMGLSDLRLRRKYPNTRRPGDSAFNNTGDLHIVFTSREFQPGADEFDKRYKFVGASFAPRPGDQPFPFEQITRRPLIYIALGTIMNTRTGFYQTAFDAFRDFPGTVIVSAGASASKLTDVPPNFIVREFVPQLQVLERADLFITHGGMNSATEAMYYGVPVVAVPQQFEQTMVAGRMAECGAGVAIGMKAPYGRISAHELRAAAEQVLGDSTYRRRAKALGESLRTAGGHMRAADEIQLFARWANRISSGTLNKGAPLRFDFIPYPLWRRKGMPALIRPLTTAAADDHPPRAAAELAHYLTRWNLLPPDIDAPTMRDLLEADRDFAQPVDLAAQPSAFSGKIRLPAQWERMEAVILSFPVLYPPMWRAHLEMIEAISHAARADVLIPAPGWAAAIRVLLKQRGRANMGCVRILHLPTDDVWVRDYGPIVGLDEHGRQAVISAVYDPLPTYPQTRDNAMPEHWAAHSGIPVRRTDVHTEGGNIWSDGAGTLIMSDDIEARNPGMTRAQIEADLHSLFTFDKLIVTPSLRLEETGHVDLLCKLADARTMLVSAPTVPLNGERLRATAALFAGETNAAGESYRVIELPSPRFYVNWGVYPVWRSYTNALTVNGRVLVPVFDAPEDAEALRVYRDAMPDHEIIPIHCAATVNGGGAVHCLTKEVPAGNLT
ncbi:MAG: agmatine deiminase family protein [Anaerolinea sp.]|nr:agmatine deiminase family protein [Anaerolinea sp.]